MTHPAAPALHTRTIVVTTSKPFPFGGAFFSGARIDEGRSKGKSVQAVAKNHIFPKGARIPKPGDIYEITGWYLPNPYDRQLPQQLHVQACKLLKPVGRVLFYFLRYNQAFRGLYIGPAKWDRIERHFSADPQALARCLDAGDIGALVDNGLLSAELVGRLVGAWRSVDREEINLINYLQEKGFDTRHSVKLMRVWGKKAVEYLEENPYYLVAFEKWAAVDDIARRLYGLRDDDPRRLVGAVLAALNSRLVDGKHTLTTHNTLLRLLALHLKGHPNSVLEQAIGLAVGKGVVIGKRDRGYQLDGAELMERRVKEMLEAIHFDSLPRQQQISFAAVTADFIGQVVASAKAEQGFTFNDEQKQAIRMALTSRVSVICGGAGCGKTAVLRAILAGIKLLNSPFYQVALAGRAAKRMTESTGEEAYTVARFLYLAYHNKLNLDGDPYIILDEASMIDLSSMDRILRLLNKGARLLFVGDEGQLPPISFGLVFHKLVESDLIARTRLVKVERSTDVSRIADIAHDVREKRVPELSPYPGRATPGVSFIGCRREDIDLLTTRLYCELGDEGNTQIIAIRNDDMPGGVYRINRTVQDALDSRHLERHGEQRLTYVPNEFEFWDRYSVGDKVMYLKNDPELRLNNGTLGGIIDIRGETLVIDFEDTDAPIEVRPDDLDKLALAYAVTTHKAQGSQFRRVIIPVIPSPRLLDNALIYTALTRGIEQVVFVGDCQAYQDAITGLSGGETREVGFKI
jgi:exodeoxyribonuclease V alpha subunit